MGFFTAVRQEAENLESSVVMHELEMAISYALYVFMKLTSTSLEACLNDL